MRSLSVQTGILVLILSSVFWAESLKQEQTIPNLGIVRQQVKAYVESGPYWQDVDEVIGRAQAYLEENLSRFEGKKPAIVLDIDETSISNLGYMKQADYGYVPDLWTAWIESGQAPPIESTLSLFRYARKNGVAVIFISSRDNSQQKLTARNLERAGYTDYQALILRTSGAPTSAAFKAGVRKKLSEQGYFIVLNIGDQFSDLEGGYAEATFKLPNPMYYVP